MKILQLVADGAPGGGTNHVMQLLQGLNPFQCTLMTQQDSYLYNAAKELGIEVIGAEFFRSRFDRETANSVAKAIRKIRPDLIHCHGGRAAFYQTLKPCRIPAIYTVHGFHHARKSLVPQTLGWAAEFWTIRNMDKVLFVADYDRDLAIRQKLLPSGKPYEVIHNGIAPLKPSRESQKLGIGFVGRFVYQKNPQLFLDVAKRIPEAKFVMIGGGDLDNEVREHLNRLGLQDRVELYGSLDHASALKVISKLDMLLMTPRWEGLPLLPLEAMFMKVPVVSTSVGGIPEVITHNETGLLSENEDADQLAAEVRRLLNDPGLRAKIVEQAYQKAHAEFSQTRMLERIATSYRTVINSLPITTNSRVRDRSFRRTCSTSR